MPNGKKKDQVARKITDAETRLLVRRVTDWMESAGFAGAKVEAYRLSPHGGIRLRVVHEAFHNRSLEERDTMTRDLMENVPEEIDEMVFYILVVSPKEAKRDAGGIGFDNPSPIYI